VAHPPVRQRQTVNYSDQQQSVIQEHSPIIVVKALAGTGKTTMCVGFADARPKAKILYISFGKAVQEAAQQRFGPNTECRTTHSLAFQAVGKHFGKRVTKSWRAMTVRSEAGLPDIRSAALVQSVLTKFFQSADSTITMAHTREAEVGFKGSEAELHQAVNNAKLIWRRMQDRSDSISMSPDAYLKMWSLSSPRLNYDYLICDEWQDTNPVTAHIVNQQKHANLLVVGDPHQSIFGFRGAMNAMDDYPTARQLHLSQTWRFGPKVATMANLVLNELKGEKLQIQGMGKDVPYVSGAPITKLSRTNAQLFKDATLRHGRGVHWVGGIEGYNIGKILDAYFLYANKRDKIRDQFMRNFSSFSELVTYGEEAKDPEARILGEVIEAYQHETPALVSEIRANAVEDAAAADMTLTTAHKAKGLDWNYVQIADDFEILAETEAALAADPFAQIEEQELNLLYVGFSRAKCALQVNQETRTWLENLPKHRAARQTAREKARLRFSARP
jgi:superfamily I DNA/RNA helicase